MKRLRDLHEAYLEEAAEVLPDLEGIDIEQYRGGEDPAELQADLDLYTNRDTRTRKRGRLDPTYADPETVLKEHFAMPEQDEAVEAADVEDGEKAGAELDLSVVPSVPVQGPVPSDSILVRTPTIYSHMDAGLVNKNTGEEITDASSGNWGPHTVAHALLDHVLKTPLTSGVWEQLEQVFVVQVDPPEDIEALIAAEKANPGTTQAGQLKRALERYRELFDLIETDIDWGYDNPDSEDKLARFEKTSIALRELIDLHPYAVYAWKSRTPGGSGGASKKSSGGKGEPAHLSGYQKGELRKVAMLIDGFKGKFADEDGFRAFILQRLEMVIDPDQVEAFYDRIDEFKKEYAAEKASKKKKRK